MSNRLPLPPVPDAVLERFLLGELPADRREALASRLETDPLLRTRLDALDASNRDILERHPTFAGLRKPAGRSPEGALAARSPAAAPARPRHAVTAHRNPPSRRGYPWTRRAAPAFASLALLAAAAWQILVPRQGAENPGPGILGDTDAGTPPSVRLKGLEAGLAIYRKSRGGIELLPPHSQARPGDTLQIFYRSFRNLHGMVFSVDGAGSLTLHLPEVAGRSVPLRQGGLRPLPHAYLLDRAPSLERFFLITSPAPFSADSLLAALRPAWPDHSPAPDSLPGLPDGFAQQSYTLLKSDGPERPAPDPQGPRSGEGDVR